MIGLAAAIGVCVALVLYMLRLFLGPTLQDRALAAHGIVLKVAVAAAAIAVMLRDEIGINVAFALVLATFVTAAALLKFFRVRTFQAPMARHGRGGA